MEVEGEGICGSKEGPRPRNSQVKVDQHEHEETEYSESKLSIPP